MLTLAAYIFQYGLFILAGLMYAWSFALRKNYAFTKRLFFRVFPFVFAIMVFAKVSYSPIVITSPPNHTVIHPGEKVLLRVELTPAFLSSLYPWEGLRLYRCYTCTDWPPGISTEGALTGSPYTFILNIPQNQPADEIFVDAYSSMKMGEHAAVRSRNVDLVVNPYSPDDQQFCCASPAIQA
jgi:hypothetical protein